MSFTIQTSPMTSQGTQSEQADSLETGAVGKASAPLTPEAKKSLQALVGKALTALAAAPPDNNKPALKAPNVAVGETNITDLVIALIEKLDKDEFTMLTGVAQELTQQLKDPSFIAEVTQAVQAVRHQSQEFATSTDMQALIERMEDPKFVKEAVTTVMEFLKDSAQVANFTAKTGFDINNMKSFGAVDLIMVLLHLLDKLRANDAELNAKMTLGAAASVDRTAASLVTQGYDQMVGAVVGGVLGAVTAFAAVGMKATGSRQNYLNEKTNGKAMKDLNSSTKSAKDTLSGIKPGAAGVETSTLSGTAAGAPKTVNVASSDKTLSDANRKTMEIEIDNQHGNKLSELETAYAKNKFGADKWTLGGEAIGGLGMAANTFATAAAQTDVMNARAQQTLSESATNVAKQVSSEAAERNQAQNGDSRTIRDIALQILNAITQGRSGQINNLRV